MIEHRFYHEVISPFIRFSARSAENICVQEQNNDVVVLAQEAATAAYHFPEAVRGHPNRMKNDAAENLRQKLKDVVDSRKHGKLNDERRQISLKTVLAFEVNDAEEFRYVGTHILASNSRFGEFEVGDTVSLFIEELKNEFSLKLEIDLKLPKYEYSKKVVTFVTDKTFHAQNVGLRFLKRSASGIFIPVDPTIVHFEVHELNDRNKDV